jgi:hypothetical protein
MITDLIASTTVGAGGTTTIEFTGIPGTYTDLVVLLSARTTAGSDLPSFRANNYVAEFNKGQVFFSNSGAVSGFSSASNTFVQIGTIPGTSWSANSFSNVLIQLPNYAGTTQAKTFKTQTVSKDSGANQEIRHTGTGFTSFTAAITSVQIFSGNTFAQHTTAYLYGTLKGSGGATVTVV